MILEGDALLLEVMDKFYTTVLHRYFRGNELIRLSCPAVHSLRDVRRAGTDALIARHRLDEGVEALCLHAGTKALETLNELRTFVARIEAHRERRATDLCSCRYHDGLLVGVVLEETKHHTTRQRQVTEDILLTAALVPVARTTELGDPGTTIADLIFGRAAGLIGDDGELLTVVRTARLDAGAEG